MDYAGSTALAAQLNIDDRADIGAGARQAANKGRAYVADPLADQLAITVMARLGKAIGEQRGDA